MLTFVISLSIVCVFTQCGTASDEVDNAKRLLLNDPNVLQSQITELQKQMSNHQAEIQAQKAVIAELRSLIRTQEGALFVRWGSHTCPDNDTEQVYSGFAGGSYYSHTGAAAEYVCLSPNPTMTSAIHDSLYAYMYGAEYNSNAFGPDDGDDIPCVVCRSKSTVSTLMIPGTNQCTAGWRLQYHGYLAAGYYKHDAASQYICLDQNPETVINGHVNNNGKLVHPVQAVCGALECPPYVNGKFLTCAVCTK